METFVSVGRYWLDWPSITNFLSAHPWGWPLAETLHFIGLCLLVGIVGLFDLRVLGMAKGLPPALLKRLLPWGVFGFVLCLTSGLAFVLGFRSNLPNDNAFDVILRDSYLQLKLLFMFLAGINVLVYYVTGINRAVEALASGDDAPQSAKIVAGASLFLWVGVVVFGRLIPAGL